MSICFKLCKLCVRLYYREGLSLVRGEDQWSSIVTSDLTLLKKSSSSEYQCIHLPVAHRERRIDFALRSKLSVREQTPSQHYLSFACKIIVGKVAEKKTACLLTINYLSRIYIGRDQRESTRAGPREWKLKSRLSREAKTVLKWAYMAR